MIDAYKKFWQNYVNFSDRSRRSDYWYATLMHIIISLILSVLIVSTGVQFFATLASLYSFATFIPGLALVVRRLHDIGKSGWNYLFIFLPIIGQILLFVWFVTDSQPGANQYGLNPKETIPPVNEF